MFTEETSITVEFNIVTYTITYVLDKGTNDSGNPESYVVTDEEIILKDATKDGYTFAGWYSDSSFTTVVTSIASGSTEDITLYAKFTLNSSTSGDNNTNESSGCGSSLSGNNVVSTLIAIALMVAVFGVMIVRRRTKTNE